MQTHTQSLTRKGIQLRRDILTMITQAGSGHPGGSLSVIDLMVALYYGKMRIDPQNPAWEERDRFVLSKGHAAPALYAVLADKGYFPRDILAGFRQLGSPLQGHPDKKKLPGVDASTGSLGQGASIAVGMALAAKNQQRDLHIYTILGDGELQEGLVWEAAMAAAHYKLDNLTIMIDNNGLQIDGTNDEVMSLGDLAGKFATFGFNVIELADGHDFGQILDALEQPAENRPKCIIAKTIKGKGVSFLENQVGWHGKALSPEQLELALSELVVEDEE
jgi:transketolase